MYKLNINIIYHFKIHCSNHLLITSTFTFKLSNFDDDDFFEFGSRHQSSSYCIGNLENSNSEMVILTKEALLEGCKSHATTIACIYI